MATFKAGDKVSRAGAGFLFGRVLKARRCPQGGVTSRPTQSVQVRWNNGHVSTLANQQLEHLGRAK